MLLLLLGAGCSRKSAPAAASPSITVPDTGQTGFEVLRYLYSISGKGTIAGIHNREPNATPAAWTNKMDSVTGKFPGLWSGDFLFQQDNIANRQIMIDEALREWKRGAVVQLMWHACNPALSEPCGYDSTGVLSHLSDEQWKSLITDGSPLNLKWKAMIDEISVYLQYLQTQGVEVLFRPLHEMNQGAFWWGGRPGPDGTRKLYQLLHDYLTHTKGLHNLIWVWDMQDFPGFENQLADYNPGEGYWDVAALDVYDDKTGYTDAKYQAMLGAAQGKPIAIGECQKLPSPATLAAQPRWVFFMSWSELTLSANTTDYIKSVYTSSHVITLNRMPGWK